MVVRRMKIKVICVYCLLLIASIPVVGLSAAAFMPDGQPKARRTTLTFLQLNLWVECTKVPDAPAYLIDQIAALQPDIATFCELYKGPADDPVLPKLVEALRKRKLYYHCSRIDGRAVLSKYPIREAHRINQWLFKAVLDVQGRRLAVYPAHSEYRYYTCYYPRGYNDGSLNWDKLPRPITDVARMIDVCDRSDRVASMRAFVQDAEIERAKGAMVIMAGDLNEPSCLDWKADTRHMFDHRGCVVPWSTSRLLLQNGYKDAYRQRHPNAVKYPGFTFPADNADADPSVLSWAIEADERERIDFIYYYPDRRLRVKEAVIAGPRGSIVNGRRVAETSRDTFILPAGGHWPSDHKGVFVTFELR